jgi:SNF2 family DNA or RNA helicase
MLRRLKRDVSLELPAKTRQIINVDVKSRGGTWSSNPVTARRLLDAAADQKLPTAVELLRDHVQSGMKVVAFTWRKAVAEHLASELGGEFVHGGVGADKRGARMAAVANAPGGGLLAATIDSCSTGIDLTWASVAIFVELTWEPADLLQAEARLHRFGATLPVLIQYVIARGTGDEVVAHGVVGKLDTFEAIIGSTGETLADQLSTPAENVLDSLSKWAESVIDG